MKISKFLNWRKIFSQVKSYPWKESVQALKFLPRAFKIREKIILLALSGLILVFLGIFFVNRWIVSTQVIPENGGVLQEGIVGTSKNLDQHLARLVNGGLTKYDAQKNIVGDLAPKWDIAEEGKAYVFHLNPQFGSEDLASQIINKGLWKDIEIDTPDPVTLTFRFKQPFSPFLYTSTEPIFPYGPYRITKESKNEVELSARADYYAGQPYIEKIIIKLYNNQDDLLRAVSRGEIDSFALTTDTPTLAGFQKLEMKLSRQLMVFFNLSNKELQDLNLRRSLKENTNSGRQLEFRLVASDNQKNVEIAKGIAEKWAKNGIKINLGFKDNVALQKTVIPKRDYDILLYGLDYGEDPDPYPFWHSSQNKEDGRNLSNFKNTKADKLLEDARQEFDFKKREEKYAEFQKILDAEIPAFVVEQDALYYQISNDIKGVDRIVGSFEADRFLDIAKWYINTKRVKK